jgi:hypothetical protein
MRACAAAIMGCIRWAAAAAAACPADANVMSWAHIAAVLGSAALV